MTRHHHFSKDHVKRFFGLSLGGARSESTSLTVLDSYLDSSGISKSFVVDVFDSISSNGDTDGDEALLQLIGELLEERSTAVQVLAVDAPLTLPPCFLGCDASCEGYQKCKRPEVRWMKSQYLRARRKNKNVKGFTPYTQRPVDLYFRYKFPDQDLVRDDTLGSNFAPHAARMQYLQRHWKTARQRKLPRLIETWPKLALFQLQKELKIHRREATGYKNVENGAGIREKLLERISEHFHVFVYERDATKLISSVHAFDSFICAVMALQFDLGRVLEFKQELPLKSGWIQLPQP